MKESRSNSLTTWLVQPLSYKASPSMIHRLRVVVFSVQGQRRCVTLDRPHSRSRAERMQLARKEDCCFCCREERRQRSSSVLQSPGD